MYLQNLLASVVVITKIFLEGENFVYHTNGKISDEISFIIMYGFIQKKRHSKAIVNNIYENVSFCVPLQEV